MKNSKVSKLFCFLITLLLVGCATNNRVAYKKLRKNISDKKIDEAIKLVKSDKFYPEERNKLLKLLELGNLQHLNGDYYQSLKSFDEAMEVSDKLFTVSISKKAVSAISNNNMDNYYGEIYERSMIRFYQALNHFMLYQNGFYESHVLTETVKNGDKEEVKTKKIDKKILSKNEIRSHLAGARASLLEWDSLLDNYSKTMKGDSTYKSDLSSRIFGAFIHEQMGTSNDRNIAIGLYKDAKKIIFRYYNLYPSFNSKYKTFSEDFSKLHKMSKNKVKKNYIAPTQYTKELLAYIDQRIKSLKKRKRNNFTVVVQQGYVAEKIGKLIHFPLPIVLIPKTGGMVEFTAKMLANSRGTDPSITFELPQVRQKKIEMDLDLVVKDSSGKVIQTQKAVIMNPVSDIAYQTLDNKITSTYSKIGLRLATKHIAALLASHKIYESAGEFAATMSYAIANKAIAASEQADLRFWSTLPHTFRIAGFDLKPGKYKLSIKAKIGKSIREYPQGEFSIKPKETKLMNLNAL